MSKNVYYIGSKDGGSYQMRPLIYDAKFKMTNEKTQIVACILFSDPLPIYFV